MKDPLGVSPSKGNQGTTRGKEKIILTSVGIRNPRHSADCATRSDRESRGRYRGEKKVRVHINVVPRSTMNTNGGTEN